MANPYLSPEAEQAQLAARSHQVDFYPTLDLLDGKFLLRPPSYRGPRAKVAAKLRYVTAWKWIGVPGACYWHAPLTVDNLVQLVRLFIRGNQPSWYMYRTDSARHWINEHWDEITAALES